MNHERFNKILVVDDSTANLQLLMNLLSEQGYTVYPASDGALALEFVKSTLPDLILLDIKMPEMDGYEVCRRLKANERVASIPVIFLSALEEESDKVKGFQAGGVDYITKPFQPDEMLARVGLHLRLRELTERLEQEVDARTKELTIANDRLEQEIAEHRQAEEALHESRQRLDNIVTNSPGATYRCANDEHWTMEFISAGITRISGYPAEDFLNNRVRSYASIIHPDDRKRIADAVAAGLANQDHYEMDYRLLTADGTLRWVHEQGRGVFSPEGRLLCLDGVIFDTTAQREAEETLKLNTERMETLLQLNQMAGANEDELMRFAFEAAVRLTRSKLGYLALMNEDETVLNMQLWSREAMDECEVPGLPRTYPVKTTGLWGEAVRQRRPIITNDYSAPNPWKKGTPEGHVKLIRHMNLPVIVDSRIVLVAGVGNKEEDYNEGDVQQLSLLMEGMWRMIERIRAEEELRRHHDQLEYTVKQRTEELRLSRDAAEAANNAKSAFLANMSHELRTPLNAILGFSSIVRKDPMLPENQRRNLGIINRSGEHLLTLINDVLEMAKIEAGGVQLANTPFDLGGMVHDVIDMMQTRAKDKGLQLRINQSSQFPTYIVGDEPRLRQVLVNLISNAINFTQKGSVDVRLQVKHDKDQQLLFEVEDSGPGIATQDQQRIFEPFVQLGEHGGSKGTGLGLTITRQFVELMGGDISLESTPGKGTLFRIELPLIEATESDIAQAKKGKQAERGEVLGLAPGQPQYRILIVEDQADNQALLTHILDSVGLQIKIAENGKQGVELFQSWRPHLILMDRRMPVMDGEEATRRIRKLPGGQKTKIIAVTASAFKEQRKILLNAGMDDFVCKPYLRGEIYACLSKQLGIQFQYEEVTESQAQAEVRTLTSEMLSVLPNTLRDKLQEALESLESDRIDQIIQQVTDYDQELQQTLAQYTDSFDYQTILNALRKV
jgi:signal transduction histidine kinase/DNA-binding response OmpR family regulator